MTAVALQSRPHVLLVDDDAICVGASAAALDGAGFRVTCADSALSAMRLVLAARPDVIVLELALPDRDGLELLRAVHSLAGCAHLPFVLVSRTPAPSGEADVADALHKPVEGAALVSAVERALGRGPA